MPTKGIIDGSKALVFFSSVDSKGKNDSSGAFEPEAKAFAKLHKIPKEQVIGIDCVNTKSVVRAKKVLDTIKYFAKVLPEQCISLSFFGHGWNSGIQFGFNKAQESVGPLAKQISYLAAESIKVTFYACLTSENEVEDQERKNLGPATDGGFADRFRDRLVQEMQTPLHPLTGWVDGHKTKGKACCNPFVVRFRLDAHSKASTDLYDACGGAWVVEPGSESWGRWVTSLSEESKTGLRYRFPFMGELEIKQELNG